MFTTSRRALFLALVFAVSCDAGPLAPGLMVDGFSPAFSVGPEAVGLTATFLPWPEGDSEWARFINEAGQVAGDLYEYPKRAFFVDEAAGFAPGPVIGEGSNFPYALNDRGEVLFYASVPVEDEAYDVLLRPVVWNAPTDTWVVVSPPSGGEVAGRADWLFRGALNNLGQVVGAEGWGPGDAQAFLWDPAEGSRPLAGLVEGGSSVAFSLNDAGAVAGWAADANGTSHAVVWSASGALTDIGAALWGGSSQAERINAAGQVQGSGKDAAGQRYLFFWDPSGGPTRIDVPVSLVIDMNDRGQILGMTGLAGDNRGWIFDPESRVVSYINPESGYTRVMPRAINNLGQVVGIVESTDHSWRAALWDPEAGFVALDGGTDGNYQSDAQDINDAGTIVGTYWWSEDARIVLWKAPSPADRVDALVTEVQALIAGGALDAKAAAPLLTSLNNALKLLEMGNTTAALNNLEAFINKVEALMGPSGASAAPSPAAASVKNPNGNAGRLSRADGETLIAAARALIASIRG